METNLSIGAEPDYLTWNAGTTTLSLFGRQKTWWNAGTFLYETMRTINFQLCDDSKAQFIVEFKRLRQIYEVIGNKMRLCEQIRKKE